MANHRSRPESLDDPKPTWPRCPRCKGPTAEKTAGEGRPWLADYAEKHGMSHIAGIPVIVCRPCRVMAAHVDGIADEWRGESPALLDLLVMDAESGLRLRRFLDDDDPGWRRIM